MSKLESIRDMAKDLSYWDYRVIRSVDKDGRESFDIHEVHYDSDGTPHSCTCLSVEPLGETLFEFQEDMKHYQKALEKPVLDMSIFGNEECEECNEFRKNNPIRFLKYIKEGENKEKKE